MPSSLIRDAFIELKDLRLGDSIFDKIKLLFLIPLLFFRFVMRKANKKVYLHISQICNQLFRTITLKVNGVKYRLVDNESKYIVSERFENWIWCYLKPIKGDVFVDIGAHIGKYALPIAKIIGSEGRVVALEPDPINFLALQKGIQCNCLTNIIALNYAAWKENAELKLFISEVGGHHSFFFNEGKGYQRVKAVKVDEVLKLLNIRRTDWVKIDVEGAELQVLEGLSETLASHHPKLFVEVINCHLSEFKKILERYSYKFIICSYEGNSVNFFCE